MDNVNYKLRQIRFLKGGVSYPAVALKSSLPRKGGRLQALTPGLDGRVEVLTSKGGGRPEALTRQVAVALESSLPGRTGTPKTSLPGAVAFKSSLSGFGTKLSGGLVTGR